MHQLKLLRVMKQGMGSSVRNSEISDALGNAFNASECASKWKELKEADKRRLAEAGRELGPSPESPAKKVCPKRAVGDPPQSETDSLYRRRLKLQKRKSSTSCQATEKRTTMRQVEVSTLPAM